MYDTSSRGVFRAPRLDAGRANGCTAASSLGGWLCAVKRETTFPATAAVQFSVRSSMYVAIWHKGSRCPALHRQLQFSQSRRAGRGNPGRGDTSHLKTSTKHPLLVGSTPRKGYAWRAVFLPHQKPLDRHCVPCTSHTWKSVCFYASGRRTSWRSPEQQRDGIRLVFRTRFPFGRW